MTASDQGKREPQTWKVGALAELTGPTVRALHHYDHVGLLTPSGRSTTGHRLYSADDVARLYRICVLRRLGFPLDRIARVLDDPQWQLREAIRRRLDDTSCRIDLAVSLKSRSSDMAAALSRYTDPSPDETVLASSMVANRTTKSSALLVIVSSTARAAPAGRRGGQGLRSRTMRSSTSGLTARALGTWRSARMPRNNNSGTDRLGGWNGGVLNRPRA